MPLKRRKCIWWLNASLGFLFLILISNTSLATDYQQWVAKAVSVQGVVQVQRAGSATWEDIRLEDQLYSGDILRVLEKSRAALVLQNESVIRLDERTTITIRSEEEPKSLLLRIIDGAVHFFSRIKRSLRVATPFVNGAVEGTEFFVKVDAAETYFSVFKGRVLAENSRGSLLIAKGLSAVARADQPPRLEVVIHPRDAVQWALYYPPILAFSVDDFAGISSDDWQAKVRRSILALGQGDLVRAFAAIASLGPGIDDPDFFTYRAGLNLVVGRTSAAQADITQALTLEQENSRALALRAIMAVVQNRKEDALSGANKAVNADADSAAARIALSYAQQARFDLNAAREQAMVATVKAPDNAVAWARLAELQLCTGELDEALSAAQKAARLNPHLAHAQTILGYAYLTQIKIDDAKETFGQAIELDQAAPMPRLGLGLAKIRQGDLKDGRAEIEIAAGLDPDNSLLRSYLGKAYFDEKRGPLDEHQFEMAKTLDPQDPTPWFYDAIRKQTLNRPIEALQDLHRTIALNDNRAVYRSRLMLDNDLGARSASLGRIYNDLGFQQLALVEGWKSANTDSSNYSAHRFLSDSYAALPRHQVARVSELLQSQLLQPINMTPVQPQLSESNLLILEGSGPAEPSLNEFNPLFQRNHNSLLASGIIGESGIRGDELVFSGLWQRVSYGIGQFHYETDGFRENNDQNRDTYNVFLQTSITDKTSIMSEGRYSESEYGDLPLRFSFDGQDNFSPNVRQDRDEKSIRVGMKHTISPRSQVISHFTYVRAGENYQDIWGTNDVEFIIDDTGYMVEGQYLWNASHFDLTGGLGYFDRERDDTTIFFGEEKRKLELTHANYYMYSYITYPEKFTWTIGGSVDNFQDDETKDRNQINPKLGLLVTPFSGTTLRAAAFRSVKRSLAGQQTIEPTQVAGFNQFYDDVNGTSSWRYGIAVDQTISAQIFSGIEYSKREIVSSSQDIITFEIVDSHWNESLTRAYIYWTPHTLFAISAEYLYEEFKRDNNGAGVEAVKALETHRFPLCVNYFHPNGLSASLKGTYVNQDGIFGTEPADFRQGEDHFWLFDIGGRYRFPNRMGLISVGVQNLFDHYFNFQDMDLANPTIFPKRTIFGKVTFSF